MCEINQVVIGMNEVLTASVGTRQDLEANKNDSLLDGE